MKTLREHIREADKNGVAIGHFNISNIEMLWGIFSAARELDQPVIIGVSEGERSFIGTRQASALIRSLREEYDFPIFINADHTYTFEKVREAACHGFDAAIFDGAALPMEENIEETKKSVQAARECMNDVLVEGELGYIGKSSKLLDEVPENAQITDELMTSVEEAVRYVKETDVDLLAPAVGNLHGMLKNSPNPSLNIERIKEIREATNIPLVLHGGSGVSDEDFKKAIKAGISVVHVSTELRVAYKNALMGIFAKDFDDMAPYRYMQPGLMAVKSVVMERMKLFAGV